MKKKNEVDVNSIMIIILGVLVILCIVIVITFSIYAIFTEYRETQNWIATCEVIAEGKTLDEIPASCFRYLPYLRGE